MKLSPKRRPSGSANGKFWAAVCLALVAGPTVLRAEDDPAITVASFQAPLPKDGSPAATATAPPPAVDQSYLSGGCASCGNSIGGGSCATCGGGSCTGIPPCGADCCPSTRAGSFLNCVSGLICCTDPCYEPKWNLLADTSFYAAGARPVTQTVIRTDFGYAMSNPDKGEIFWAAIKGNGSASNARGPSLVGGNLTRNIDYTEASLYTEAAVDKFGFFSIIPYRSISDGSDYKVGSGLGDIVLGTKTMFLDTELILATFQFSTSIPSGETSKGLGTGHVSLEPALLAALNLRPGTFLQGELAYRFPIGGLQDYQGAMFHYNLSLNQELWKCGKSWELVGTIGLDGYQIENGKYANVDAAGNVIPALATDIGSILYVTPGFRLNFCDKLDVGFGPAFALTNDRFARDLFRFEARLRF